MPDSCREIAGRERTTVKKKPCQGMRERLNDPHAKRECGAKRTLLERSGHNLRRAINKRGVGEKMKKVRGKGTKEKIVYSGSQIHWDREEKTRMHSLFGSPLIYS